MFRISKADLNLTAPGNVIEIPLPTQEDKEWAREYEYFDEYDFSEICANGHLWRVAFALKRGFDLSCYEYESLNEAVHKDHSEVIKLLHAHGADVNSCYDTPLLSVAAHQGKLNAFKTLLELGADFDTAFDNSYDYYQDSLKKMFTRIGGLWLKCAPDQINRVELQSLKTHDREITTTFNFKSRKIMTTIREKDQLCGPAIEKFSDQENFEEIIEAYNQLQKQGGDLSSLSEYTGRSHKHLKKPSFPKASH